MKSVGWPQRIGWLALPALLVFNQPARPAAPALAPKEEGFAFGVEYMVPGLAQIYAATGARWAKPGPAGFEWEAVESKPPIKGRHTYDWTWPDLLIKEYQQAGFQHFHIYTQARNSWAGSARTGRINASFPPRPEHWEGYMAYLRNLVERYDGDGQDDMPGLRWPVRYWEIEPEWGTFWQGTAEEYLDLLRRARQAVRTADPQAQVILVGFLFMGVFDGDLDETAALQRLERIPLGPKARQGLAEIRRLLAHPELFDVVEFHSLGDWTEIPATARFLRQEMKRCGYEKPIWAGDINYNLNPMIFWGQPFYPSVAGQRAGILEWLKAFNTRNDRRHAEAAAWFRAEQAAFTAKKLAACVGEGLAGANMGNLEDWPQFSLVRGITGTGAYCGLIDTEGFSTIPGKAKVPVAARPRIPGRPRPAYYTLQMLIRKLAPYARVERLSLGKEVYAWRFAQPRSNVSAPALVVLWFEDGKGYLPGQPEPRLRLSLPTNARRASLLRIITSLDQLTPPAEPLAVNQGRIELTVGRTPMLVEEWPQP